MAECGTWAGYMAHLRNGETKCAACRQAAAEYQAAHRANNPARRDQERQWKAAQRARQTD